MFEFDEANVAGPQRDHARFHIKKPKLWWPAGSGDQHLYELKIQCGDHVETRKIGLRQIDLITDKDDVGARFAFRVNGREIFCKGPTGFPPMRCPHAPRRN
ncbi:MAG: hypothetical protein U1E15_12770 [Hyphomicrobiales bacterium]